MNFIDNPSIKYILLNCIAVPACTGKKPLQEDATKNNHHIVAYQE